MKVKTTVEYIDYRRYKEKQKQRKEKCLKEGFNLYFNDAKDLRFYLNVIGKIAADKGYVSLEDVLTLAMVDLGFDNDFFTKRLYGYDLATVLKLEPKIGHYWGEYMVTFPRPYTFRELVEHIYGS